MAIMTALHAVYPGSIPGWSTLIGFVGIPLIVTIIKKPSAYMKRISHMGLDLDT